MVSKKEKREIKQIGAYFKFGAFIVIAIAILALNVNRALFHRCKIPIHLSNHRGIIKILKSISYLRCCDNT